VDQIALPYRIALGALLVAAAVWFTVLRPKPVEAPAPAPTAPGMKGLGNAVNSAKGAVATADAAGARETVDPTADPAAASATKATPAASGAAVKPSAAKAASASDASGPILRDLAAGKVVLLAFVGRGSDDRAVASAVRAVPSHGGKVVVRTAPVGRVGDYAAITAKLKIVGTPTVLVLGKGPKARQIAGLTTTAEVDQAAGDMLR
jgi:hypothetical protein